MAGFRLGADDRDDAVAIALERAWRAHGAAAQPIHHPEAWARTIATRVCLDVLRHHQRERRWRVEEADPHELVARAPATRPDPLEVAMAGERRELLHRRLAAWTPQEQELASLLLDGQAETVTAAAWLVRSREEARGDGGAMYPQKARLLLEARRRELADLV